VDGGQIHNCTKGSIITNLILFVGTRLFGQVDPTGEWGECLQSPARNDNSFVNLASQGHCTGVFIGT
jgi:hypothetical protein